MNNNNFDWKNFLFITGNVLMVSLTLLTLIFALSEVKSWNHPANQGATIVLSGEGEVTAVPDVSVITFTIDYVAKTVADAQVKAEATMKPTKAGLSNLGIADKDISTLSYSVYPKYTYSLSPMIYCSSGNCPTPKQTLEGYEVTQTIKVKVRNVDNTGKVLALLGTNNITQITGPDFTVDNMTKIQAQAKDLAIKNARAKAEVMAKSLGVSLGRIVSFSENGNYPVPMMAKAYSTEAVGMGGDVTVPTGESVIKSNVSITYELE